jgi:hypothetical protein
MTPQERAALAAVDLDWARRPDDVWQQLPEFHVRGLHGGVVTDIVQAVEAAARSTEDSPLGVVIRGQMGAGKTHLLGEVRDRAQAQDAYFFLVSVGDGSTFWESTALCLVNGLLCPTPTGQTQLNWFLDRLVRMASVPTALHAIITDRGQLTPAALNQFALEVKQLNRQVGQECRDTARALVLYASEDPQLQDIGYDYLLSMNEMEPEDRARWGIRPGAKPAQRVVGEISRLLALTGPTLIAVDQFDTILARAYLPDDGGGVRNKGIHTVNLIGDGLMSLREMTRRTVTVISCLEPSWQLIASEAVETVGARFRTSTPLKRITDAAVARDLVARRLAVGYSRVGFAPPYPTWPVLAEAFASDIDLTPRALLQAVDNHLRACLAEDRVTELANLTTRRTTTQGEDGHQVGFERLDARFAELYAHPSTVDSALTERGEDTHMPPLLAAGLAAWAQEHRDFPGFESDPQPRGKPTLHGRLRRVLDEHTGDEAHWSFRAIASQNATAALSRLRNASILAGVTEGMPTRRLVVLRNSGWSKGTETQKALAALAAADGIVLPVTRDDLSTFEALGVMLGEADPLWSAWLAVRRPASRTALLNAALAGAVGPALPTEPPSAGGPPAPVVPAQADGPTSPAASISRFAPALLPTGNTNPLLRPQRPHDRITLGTGLADGAPAAVDLESLRRHAAIFAGSGSGKTVLIRRLIEECALQGVSTIVLDPNNDLARLGDPWPEPPPGWGPDDHMRADRYLAETDVVVWTPRREAGRPLTFQPLPDFRPIIDDPDEFGAAIDSAVASLAPRARVDGTTAKSTLGQAVLKEALTAYVRAGGSDLRGYLNTLRDLPDGVSELDRATRIANEMAQTLTAETVIDPLFGGEGVALSPGELLTPPDGKAARVSVISLVGLPSDEQRQSFVNQLQMALFAWIKRNPAGDRPLGGLFVMDEAQSLAPSGAMTACTQSTLALAAQARKYGLGLVFATQAPKGLNNRIAGNATTQFFGLLNAPVQIETAREMARAKGGDVPDIGRLGTGQFYASGEGLPLTKIQAPNCLSHHPKSPLTTEEVIERARRQLHTPARRRSKLAG